MKVMWINNDGGGFADFVDVEEGITLLEFFNLKLPDRRPDDYLIRVNRLWAFYGAFIESFPAVATVVLLMVGAVRLRAGDHAFRAGDDCGAYLWVTDGVVRVQIVTESGRERRRWRPAYNGNRTSLQGA